MSSFLKALVVTVLLISMSSASAPKERTSCCAFETRSKEAVQGTVHFEKPPQEDDCRWIPIFPAEIVMLDKARMATALHSEWFTSDGSEVRHSIDSLEEIDIASGNVIGPLSWHDRSVLPQSGEHLQLF